MGWGVNLRDAPLHVSIRAFPGRSNWGPRAIPALEAGGTWALSSWQFLNTVLYLVAGTLSGKLLSVTVLMSEFGKSSCPQEVLGLQQQGRTAEASGFGDWEATEFLQMQMRWLLLGYPATCLQANIKSPFIRHTSMASISLNSTVKYRCWEFLFWSTMYA